MNNNTFEEQVAQVVEKRESRLQHKQQIDRLTSLEKSVISSMRQLVQFLDGKTTKTEVVNQIKNYATPKDIKGVISALDKLEKSITGAKLDITPLKSGLGALEDQLKKLPKEYPEYKPVEEVTVKNQLDLKPLEKAIKAIQLKAPDVQVAAPQVKVDAPDLSSLKESLSGVISAINKIKLPATDLSKVEKKLDEANKHLKKLVDKPVGGSGGGGNGTPYVDHEGKFTYLELNNGAVPVAQLKVTERYDYSDPETIYQGAAPVGTLDNALGWEITKYDLSNPSDASGKVATDVSWNNRASGSYA